MHDAKIQLSVISVSELCALCDLIPIDFSCT